MEKLSNIKALAFDLDGTLLRPDKTISPRTHSALRRCMEKGIKIIIATGRGMEGARPYRDAIGMSGPQVYYNGAEVLDMPEGKTIHTQFLRAEAALFALQLSRAGNHYFQAYFSAKTLSPDIFASSPPPLDREILVTEKPGEESAYYKATSGVQPLRGDLEAAFSLPSLPGIIKCMFITPEEHHEKLRNAIIERFGDTVSLVRSSPVYLELIAQGVSKGAGLLHALNYAGIRKEDAIAFGDEENDLSMFAAAGFSAAPSNAIEKVRNAARFHIDSSENDGIPRFLEETVLD